MVDNGSTDDTRSIIQRYPVLVLAEGKRGRAAAWNKGARSARGEIIASTDADCLVDVNWAKEINRAFQDPGVDAVMGFTEGINKNFWACMEQGNFEEFWFHKIPWKGRATTLRPLQSNKWDLAMGRLFTPWLRTLHRKKRF